MGTRYSTNSASGYNATPPADDGTVSEANKVKYSTVKTKLADPAKTLADDINTDLVEHFDRGPIAITSNTTLGATHFNKVIQVSGAAVTLTLTDAATLAAGWYCDVVSTDASNTVALARATASNMINETSADVTIQTLQSLRVVVNAAANGFLVDVMPRHSKAFKLADDIIMSAASIIEAEGAAVASATTTEIWATDGNTRHITGVTTITSLGTAAQAGQWQKIIFDGILTLTHGANLNLPGSANITTAADDFAWVYADTTTQHDVLYFKKDGTAVVGAVAATQAEQETGTSITAMVTPGRQQYHQSAVKSWIRFNGTGTPAIGASYNITSLTDDGAGMYTITLDVDHSSANYAVFGGCKSADNNANSADFICCGAIVVGSYFMETVNSAGTRGDMVVVSAGTLGDQ